MLDEDNFDENDASKVKVGLQDGAWYTGFNGYTFVVTISQILIELWKLFVHCGNICQTIPDVRPGPELSQN